MAEDKQRKKKREAGRAARKREIVNWYKRRKKCCDCGYNDNPHALEFDHLDPSQKSRTVASMMNFSWERIKEEIAKCVVRCANCHQIKSVQERRDHYGKHRRHRQTNEGGLQGVGEETRQGDTATLGVAQAARFAATRRCKEAGEAY